MKVHDRLDACVDCVALIANGDAPDDRPDLAEVIRQRWPADVHLEVACGEECEGYFLKSACEVCGSRLGGMRHPIVALCAHEECSDALRCGKCGDYPMTLTYATGDREGECVNCATDPDVEEEGDQVPPILEAN